MRFATPFTVLDGGLSTVLESAGFDLRHPLWTARLIAERPEALVEAHLAYLRAGAEVVITASYQASVEGLQAAGLGPAQAVAALASTTALAREAVERHHAERPDRARALVAASVGPFGATRADGSEYHGDYGVDHAALRDFHAGRLAVLIESAPDLLACETIPTVAEARALADALDGFDAPPSWLAFTCRDESRTAGGDRIEDAVEVAATVPGIVAVGVNCTSPRFVEPLLRRAATVTDLPLVAYANGGQVWEPERGVWEGPPVDADDPALVTTWLEAGARIVGGCCGVGPDGIRGLRAWRDSLAGARD